MTTQTKQTNNRYQIENISISLDAMQEQGQMMQKDTT